MTKLLSSLIQSLKEKAKEADYIIYVKNLQEEFVWMNDYAKKILATDKDGKINKALFANDLDIVKEDKCVSKVYFIDENNPLISKNRSFAFTKWPVFSDIDSEAYIVGFGFEITDWLIDAGTLNFFKNVLDSMTDSFVITEPNYPYKILYCNSSFESLSGRSRKEILGKTPTQVLKKHPGDEELRNVFNKKIENFEIADATFRNKNARGVDFISHLKVIPLYFNDDDTPDYLMGIQRDISHTYYLKQAGREKTAKLKAFFNATTNYLWLLDKDGFVEEMNDAAKLQGKYIGLGYSKIKFVDGRWWLHNSQQIKTFVDTVFSFKQSAKLKTKMLVSTDKEITVQLLATPIIEDELEYVVVEATDVSDLEAALLDAQSVAKGALQQVIPEEALDERYLEDVTSDQVERIIRAEVGLKNLEPKVVKLNDAVFDPEEGLVVKTNSIDKNVEDIKEALVNPALVKFFKNIPTILENNKIVRWALIFTLGAAGINVVENFSHKVEFIWNELRELEESVSPDSEL